MDHYQLSQFEKVQSVEKKLSQEIAELKEEIEESEIIFGKTVRPLSSVSMPMNPQYLAEERKLAIKKALDVSGAADLKSQGQVIIDELDSCLQSDITTETLPLLLHQFFLNQMQSFVQCNHMHMLRWRRFCKHTEAIERIYPKYRQRLNGIKKEHEDARCRAQRLSAAYQSFILKDNKAARSLKSDDIAVFFRWLVVHLHSVKKVFGYLKLLQWLPVIHRNNIDLQISAPVQYSDVNLVKSAQWNDPSKISIEKAEAKASWTNVTAGLDFSYLSPASTPARSARNTPSMTAVSELAFSGIVSNEVTLGIPCHVTDLSHFRAQLESLTTEYGIPIRTELTTSADEMELFGAVNRHFKTLFNRQMECLTFHQYDNPPEGYENWGVDSASHCLKKTSNWVKHVQMKPRKEAHQLRQMTYLKEHGNVDELLRSQNRFLTASDFAQVTEALKQHAVAVREPPQVQSLSVATNQLGKLKTRLVWDRIYENTAKDSNKSTQSEETEEKKYSSQSKRRDSYDYGNTMQMLGLDEGDDSASQDPTVIQGAYLSFLHLRHLKIRDLRRQCLATLNYFRSIERTITIYDGGLSEEAEVQQEEKSDGNNSGKKRKTKTSTRLSERPANKKSNQSVGGKGQSLGIGSHQYVYNTPADYKVEQSRFMEFTSVENHDDFYSLDSDLDGHEIGEGSDWKSSITSAAVSSGSLGADSTPHVQDHRGYFIIYDSALKDFEELDQELILVASQYIEKDSASRNCMKRPSMSRDSESEIPADVNISSYAHRDVDRFAVLHDLWMCELNFLVNKRKMLDVLAEAYQTTFEDSERSNVAQLITDLLHQRPRYDFTDEYFIRTYRGECACLRLKTTLLSQILTSHMDECKHYLSKINRPMHVPGMPLFTTTRQEVSVNLPKPSLRHVDMLEFHPTVGLLAYRVVDAFDSATHRMVLIHQPKCMTEKIGLEKQVLEHAQREWEGMAPIGSSFSKQIQKDLFSEDFVEDVYILNDAVQSLFKKKEGVDASKEEEEDEVKMKIWTQAVDVVFLRHRLIEAAWDTEVLSRLYKRIANEMGYDEFHMYLRLLQFEFASRKERIDPSPSMISNFTVDDINADRYVPATLMLAAHEMDENHLSKFSFRNREGFLQLIQSSSSLENFRVALACQVAHKNALTVAVTLAENCAQWKDVKSITTLNAERAHMDTSDSRSNVSVATSTSQLTNPSRIASASAPKHLGSANLKYSYEKQKRPEAFLSIQLEKLGPRDVIVNAFVRKKETQGMLLKKESELQKLKRSLVTDFCKEVSFRMSLHAMRGQIITSYSAILTALEPFPKTRDNYFLIGRPNEKKRKLDDVTGMIPDPKVFQKRPRRVISPDGKCFMNLWFIPHFTEVLNSYRNQDYEVQNKILNVWLIIAASLHDIILHLCACARLGSSSSLHKIGKIGYTVSADWGGAEGIGSHLSEVQEQIDNLDSGPSPYTRDPSQVAEFLSSKKAILTMIYDAAVRHSIRETFLAMDNVRAYRNVTDNMHFGLPPLTDAWETSITCLGVQLPQPLDPGSSDARSMFPWLSFQHCNGRHPTLYAEQWEDPESSMQLCLAGLNDIERQLANGEILGVSVLLQEVLNNGTIAYKDLEGSSTDVAKGFLQLNPLGKKSDLKPTSASSKSKIVDEDVDDEDSETPKQKSVTRFSPILPLDKIKFPIDAFKLMKTFLRLWKQLELFKLNWGKLKLNTKSIETPALYREMNHVYRAEILLPVYTTIARFMGKLDMYVEIASDDLPLPPPPGAPELTVRARLLIKLLELCELKMISETRHRIGKEYTLVLAERSRDETALPADLWRQHQAGSGSSMRESFVVGRPHFVDDFVRKLMSGCRSENGHVIFDKTHLNDAVASLAADVMKRERENYENYSIYYENLLRHHHRLLYVKELEMKAAEPGQANGSGSSSSVQAQFQLADRSHELILEITALRAKVAEMREMIMTMDQDIREEVRRDYQDLVQHLFEVCFQMKSRLALCHLSIHDDVRNLISETRSEAMKSLGKLKNEAPTSTAEERLLTIAAKEKQVDELQNEKYKLNQVLTQLKALNHWKQSTNSGRYKTSIEKLRQEVARTRRDCFTKTLIAKEEAELRFEELQAARKSFEGSNQKLMKTHEQIERDKKLQKEKEYRETQEQRNRKQLAQARQRDMERMIIELQEKDKRLKALTSDVERHNKIEQTNQNRIQRSLKQMHTQLSIERTLKLDAFDRVDNLQAQVFDTEKDTALVASSRPTSATVSISKSAVSQRSRNFSNYPSTPTTPKIKVRPMSCGPLYEPDRNVQLPKKRPQTTANTLRNRIAAAILTDIQPPADEHETVVRLGRVVQ